MLRKFLTTALVFGSVVVSTAANADPVNVGQWYTFGFGAAGSSLANGSGFVQGTNPASLAAPDAPWTFTLGSAGSITVVDGFNSGDQFTISDFGSLVGTTSAPTRGADCGSDITCALNDSHFSSATFGLGAGSHSITGTATLSPFGGGAGFFMVSSAAVPEASTWALMILGFGGIGMSLRRRRKVELQTA